MKIVQVLHHLMPGTAARAANLAPRGASVMRDAFPTDGRARVRFSHAVLATLAVWLVFGLVGHDPWKPDEAYTFGLVRDFLQTRDVVVPTLAGEPFVEKPPLFLVVAGAVASAVGGLLPMHDAARLATGLFVALALGALGLAARELCGARAVPIAVLAAAGCIGTLARLHQLITDVALFAGIAVGLYGLALARRTSGRGGLVLGAGAAIAFLAKGLLGPGWLGLTALVLATLSPWRRRDYAWTLLIAAAVSGAVALTWMGALWLRSPELFREWLVDNNFGRYLGLVQLGPHNSRAFYFALLPWYAFPALPLAAAVLWRKWRSGQPWRSDPAVALPLVTFVVMFLVLVAASDSRDLYALPLVLPLALLCGAGADIAMPRIGHALGVAALVVFVSGAFVLWSAWAILVLGLGGPVQARLLAYQPGFVAEFHGVAFAAAVVATVMALVVFAGRARDIRSGLLQWLAGLALCWALVNSLWLDYLDAGKSYRGVFASLSTALEPVECVATWHLGEGQRALLPYFTRATAVRIESAPDTTCTQLLVQGTRRDQALPPSEQWSLAWEGARAGDGEELYRLYVQELPTDTIARYP